jgi:polyisoprenoid-binding protein YceI
VALIASIYAVSGLAAPSQAAPNTAVAQQSAAPTPPSSAAPDATMSPTPTAAAPPAAPVTPTGAPSRWTVDRGASAITFGYDYEGDSGATHFNGRFTNWSADIRFDPNNLDASSVVVRIQTGSASTGVPDHDNALPTAAWFNVAAFPTAEVRSTSISARGPGRYEARGTLTIRGQSRPVTLPFTLTINGAHASVSGSTHIGRRDFGIGAGEDGDDLISRNVDISVRVEATRAS